VPPGAAYIGLATYLAVRFLEVAAYPSVTHEEKILIEGAPSYRVADSHPSGTDPSGSIMSYPADEIRSLGDGQRGGRLPQWVPGTAIVGSHDHPDCFSDDFLCLTIRIRHK
jgi:hypothetical protein